MDLKTIKLLAEKVRENGLTELTIESEGKKITLKREIENFLNNTSKVEKILPPKIEKSIEKNEVEKGNEMLSPMVGTFYSAPSPDAEPFVKIGDRVEIGDTLCIVEAMKMMNEIKSTFAGTVVGIDGENGKIVKKGERLFTIK